MQLGITPSVSSTAAEILRRRQTRTTMTMAIGGLGLVLALITGVALNTDTILSDRGLRPIMIADLAYVVLVAALLTRRVQRTFAERRRNQSGSSLHIRLMGVFALVALLPTILVAVFATATLNFGLEGWFSDRVRNVVGNSLAAAEAYEAEHRENLTSDAAELAAFLNDQKRRFPLLAPGQIRELLNRGQVQTQRELVEAFVIDGAGRIQSRGERSYRFDYEDPGADALARATQGETVIIKDTRNYEFRALVRLEAYADRFLYVTRDVDGAILDLLDETRETVGLYQQLERDRGKLLLDFALIYLGFAAIVITAAIWLGMWFADRLSRPVSRLASAAQRVGSGDLEVRVEEGAGDDEIAVLGRAFNRMTHQVKGQRDALVEANAETERRRRLFDSILTSVTAGVIGLDSQGRIEMLNSAAVELLDLGQIAPNEVPIHEAVPEFAPLFDRLDRSIGSVTQSEVRLERAGHEEVVLVRMATRAGSDGQLEGFVVTFDDVSDLVSAQRMAAWGDVARRIAHEIKNPLTPIQLSAERLRRKFAPQVGEGRAQLEQYADVIIRQTGDLRRIVDEFSEFARMPAPQRKRSDIMKVLRDALALQVNGRRDVTFDLSAPDGEIMASIDETMISQALNNLLKNASEAIDEYIEKWTPQDFTPQVRVIVSEIDGALLIQIQDNGIGLPSQPARLFEPYVTHKDKGTGLGLSIVRKIIEEHAGQLELMDAPVFDDGTHYGAEARILLAIGQDAVLAPAAAAQ